MLFPFLLPITFWQPRFTCPSGDDIARQTQTHGGSPAALRYSGGAKKPKKPPRDSGGITAALH